MSYSTNTTVASGVTAVVNVSFPYIRKEHVKVKLDNVANDTFEWLTDSTIELASVPVAGTVIKVYRETPAEELIGIYSSPSILAGANLNESLLQLLFVAQEAYDIGGVTKDELEAALDYIATVSVAVDEAQTAAALSASQAHTYKDQAKDYRDQAALIAGFNPNDYLKTAQNLFDLGNKPLARSNLGLGTAAILNHGTGDGNLVRVQTGGKLPALDGSDLINTGFAPGTRIAFQQTAAPTGWTKDTSHNDKALRVVSGSVGSGGSNNFSTVMAQTTTGNKTLSTSEIPSHGHGLSMYLGIGGGGPYPMGGDASGGGSGSFTTGGAGGGGAHNHTIMMDIKYLDLIIAQKD